MLVAFTVFGAAVGVTGYLAIQEITERAVLIGMPPAAPDPAGARASAPTDESAERVAPAPAASMETVDAPTFESAPVITESPQESLAPEKARLRRPATENRIPKGGAAPANPRAVVRAVEPETTGATDAAEIGAPAPTVASAPIAQQSPVADRWETMSAAIANCSRENFLAGVVCTERVRGQYCEGFWGQVPQCRAATRPGNSR